MMATEWVLGQSLSQIYLDSNYSIVQYYKTNMALGA